MSFNMRDYVSNDHIESIGEIAKSQSSIIQALSLENSKLQTQLQQKENIIKEVRKILQYYLSNPSGTKNGWNIDIWKNEDIDKLNEYLEILDKGE